MSKWCKVSKRRLFVRKESIHVGGPSRRASPDHADIRGACRPRSVAVQPSHAEPRSGGSRIVAAGFGGGGLRRFGRKDKIRRFRRDCRSQEDELKRRSRRERQLAGSL